MNYKKFKRTFYNSMFVVFLCNYCIYSQDCEDGYTYYSELPDNVTNASSCFYNADLAAISELININSLTYESPLDVGNQTWLNNRLFNWVLTFTPSGSFGINQKLSQLPDNFSQLSALASLYIEKHDLIELPDSFTQLANVYNLYVSNNWLISLPEDFGNLTNLQMLDLGYNQLESIPESIGSLENLEYLFLFNNQLTSLPETICDLNLDWDGISPQNYPYFASGGNFLCDFDLIPDCVENSSNINISMEQNYYSFLLEAPQDCCQYYLDEGLVNFGDINSDGTYNVLDVVMLANCVLSNNCAELLYYCAADINGDGGYNVLDVVMLANCVLGQDCGG